MHKIADTCTLLKTLLVYIHGLLDLEIDKGCTVIHIGYTYSKVPIIRTGPIIRTVLILLGTLQL